MASTVCSSARAIRIPAMMVPSSMKNSRQVLAACGLWISMASFSIAGGGAIDQVRDRRRRSWMPCQLGFVGGGQIKLRGAGELFLRFARLPGIAQRLAPFEMQ